MAITGTFQADFTAFYTAVQKAEVSLKSFETGSGKVATQLDRMANSLSGTKIVQQATIAAEAVERIGGVSKLTVAELQKVSGVAQEAAAKLRAMGEEVPPKIQHLAEATKQVNTEFTSLSGGIASVNRLLGAFGAAVSVGAVVNFGKLVFDTASQIHDLALEIGISTDELQGFKAAAQESGASIETVGKAINHLSDALATGSPSTIQAFKDLGLEMETVRAMPLGEAFLTVTDAIKQVQSPALLTQTRLELLGKAGNQLGAAIQEGFRATADAAEKMSAQTIKDLEAAQDAWEKLGNQVVLISGQMIAATIGATRQITSSWQQFFQFVSNAASTSPGVALALAAMGDAADHTVASVDKVAASTGPTIAEQNRRLAESKKHAQDVAAANAEFARTLDQAMNEARRLWAELDKLNLINVGLRESVGGVADGTLAEVRAWLQAREAVDALYESIRKLEQIKAGEINVAALPSGSVDTETIARLKDTLKVTTDWQKSLKDVSASLTALAQVSNGAFSEVARQMSTMVVGTEALITSIQALQRASVTTAAGMVAAFSAALGIFIATYQIVSAVLKLFGFGGGGRPGPGTVGSAAGRTATGGTVTNSVVLNEAQQRGLSSSMGGTTIHIDVHGNILGSQAGEEIARLSTDAIIRRISQNKGGSFTRLRGALGT